MRPWLREAISSTRPLEYNFTVDGPLTWRSFHQMAGSGSAESCQPQPVPQLRVSAGPPVLSSAAASQTSNCLHKNHSASHAVGYVHPSNNHQQNQSHLNQPYNHIQYTSLQHQQALCSDFGNDTPTDRDRGRDSSNSTQSASGLISSGFSCLDPEQQPIQEEDGLLISPFCLRDW
ncbi:unnamed protein product, partial [Protopolystoma xenopodis]